MEHPQEEVERLRLGFEQLAAASCHTVEGSVFIEVPKGSHAAGLVLEAYARIRPDDDLERHQLER